MSTSDSGFARALTALRVLADLGYAFEAGGEPFIDTKDSKILARVLENGASLSAIHPEDGEIDLMTSIAAFDYATLSKNVEFLRLMSTRFTVHRGA